MLRRNDVLGKLSHDDFEEATLLNDFFTLYEVAEKRRLTPTESAKGIDAQTHLTNDEASKVVQIVNLLGYDPRAGRVQRTQGRVRSDALPAELPPKFTELRSCLGHTYVVQGYCAKPRAPTVMTQIIYTDQDSNVIVRSIANLLAGHLVSGVALVTWDGDARGIKKDMVVPINKRRTMTKAELKADEHADPEAAGNWVKPKGRY